ncbi:hypothetical protein RUM43_007671 [Polyplax serrata]|uniref:Dendritic cell-specific transmembrane protein-like domain-containing protein n=1 Tax=Polyplax serrata TaxID=468196 RepID=A0AAN8PML5_POLSC
MRRTSPTNFDFCLQTFDILISRISLWDCTGVVYYAILIDLEFGPTTTLFLGYLIGFVLAFGNATSVQVRCVTLLTFPSLCSKSGRGVLKTIVLAYVLGGPFMTISNNAKEAVRVFGCTTNLAYNLTKTRYELMVKPFQDALFQMKHETNEVAETLASIQDVIEPIVSEIEDTTETERLRQECDALDYLLNDTKRSNAIEEKYSAGKVESAGKKYEREYKRKLEYRCYDIINRGTLRCRQIFADSYRQCTENLSPYVSWLLCWPMKLTYICNLEQVFGGTAVCDPSGVIQPGFGEGYATLKNIKSALRSNFRDVNIQFEVKKPASKVSELKMHHHHHHSRDMGDSKIDEVNVKSAADVVRKITKTFDDKKTIFDVVILLIKRLLALMYLRVVYQAAQYHENYLTDIEYDNKYITKYYRKIDERRRTRNQRTLLPMKKIERQNFVDPYVTLPMSEERKRIFGQSFKLILEMITATTFILLDRLFYETLDIVAKHALVEYTQTGEQDMTVTVKGTGMMANLVRAIVKGFNIKRRVKVIKSNKRCLPKPTMLSNYYLYKIYGTYFMIWLFILLEGYTQRLNRAICAYFYPKREKKRVLFLYNETLKRRIGFFKYMRERIRRKAREINLSYEANILLALRLKNRETFDWLRYFPMGKRKCLICGEPEPSKTCDFHQCSTSGCEFIHCHECWKDVGEICYGCQPMESDEDICVDSNGFSM